MEKLIVNIVMKYNLPLVAFLVILEILSVYFIDDKTLIAIVSAVVGSVITALLNERLTLIQYFYGSSKGVKLMNDQEKTESENINSDNE